MRKDAELIVDICMSIGKDEAVTIITDNDHLKEANALAAVAVDRGAFPVIANNDAQVSRGLKDTHFPMAPPKNLHQAMVHSDTILIITNLEWANRFAHISAVKESCANNAKIASVEEGMGSWNLMQEDIQQAVDRAHKAAEILNQANRVRVTSAVGTDVEVSIERRPALEVIPIKNPGDMMGPLPLWTEVAFAAVEDQTEGRIVVDGVMLGIGVPGAVNTPIVWEVKGGKAVSIEGGEEAERLKNTIEGVDGADIIGEFAFGTSEKAPFGTPSEKGRRGTIHFALGDNHNAYPGGQNVSTLHLDGVVRDGTLQVVDTGQYIVKDGQWMI
ncbi:MAG: aminopeptidase [Candidatus Bipolaricaulia bacterium]